FKIDFSKLVGRTQQLGRLLDIPNIFCGAARQEQTHGHQKPERDNSARAEVAKRHSTQAIAHALGLMHSSRMSRSLRSTMGSDGTLDERPTDMQQLTPHLMFQDGRAEEALNFYVELFGGETILLLHYGEEAEGLNGKVQIATINIAGQQINFIDISHILEIDSTPSLSVFLLSHHTV